MKVLIACEESQTVCAAFRAKGHEAYSCDIMDCSGGHPEWHIKGDVLDILKGQSRHLLDDGSYNIMIAHPPCTYLANSGVSWLFSYRGKSIDEWLVREITGYDGPNWEHVNIKRFQQMFKAARFFAELYTADIERICIENPIMHKYAKQRISTEIINMIRNGEITNNADRFRYHYDGFDEDKPQIIQPWMFGHMEQKATCLWLKNLPQLKPTNNVKDEMMKLPDSVRQRLHYLPPGKDRQKIRSKTFDGIAKAMADQWG